MPTMAGAGAQVSLAMIDLARLLPQQTSEWGSGAMQGALFPTPPFLPSRPCPSSFPLSISCSALPRSALLAPPSPLPPPSLTRIVLASGAEIPDTVVFSGAKSAFLRDFQGATDLKGMKQAMRGLHRAARPA
eukprot:1610165-Rhodomonas_salina.1